MFNIIIFGKPGSGKGTQADFLKNKYDLYHISTGDLFRKNITTETKLGLEAKSYLDNGDLVPDTITIKMLENEVLSNKDVKGYIFDGFPRTLNQAESLDFFLESINLNISATIALDVSEDELTSLSNALNVIGEDSKYIDLEPDIALNNLISDYLYPKY